jgi:peptide/nickel transport system substrate-binding protein
LPGLPPLILAVGLAATSVRADDWVETPSLAPAVAAGTLPPVAQRVPEQPRVIDLRALGREPGRHGGTIRMLMGGQRDIRMLTVYGYARLVGFDQSLALVPDILESYEVRDGRIFTLRLRRGHKWSDGHPFTAEDIRYAWEDVLRDPDLSPGGLPPELLAGGEPPAFEVLDPLAVRFTWAQPNPDFLPALAGARPLYLHMPAHYLRQFHRKYQDPEKLAALAKKERVRSWTALHDRMARQYRPENPELPTLEPWRNTTKPPSQHFVFERNPFFHRVDAQGRQLPYVDRVVLNMGSTSLIPAKTGAGDSDLQARYINFDDYTFLSDAAKRHGLKVRLWERGEGSRVAILPNLNYEDPVWREVMRDLRFRRALSLAIDRREINKAVYFGLARESADTVLPQSPLYRPDYQQAWARHDPALARRLLDEMGLRPREGDGLRLLPDGRLAEVIIESSGESTEETDVLELVGDHWRAVGVKLFVRSSQRTLFRNRVFAGKAMMSKIGRAHV